MNIYNDMFYLCLCALKGEKPDSYRVSDMDMEALYKICRGHKVTALVCSALETVITPPECFSEDKVKALRKEMLLDEECRKIAAFMRKNDIFYLPLKGAILKDYYPMPGMREMSDIDIFYDVSYREKIKEFMLSKGYECAAEVDSHDAYKREPVYNFEMHQLLFSKAESEIFYKYYKDIEKRLLRDENTPCYLRMTHEDFYIFIILHEYKHFSAYGTGIRSLLDIIVLLEKFENTLDWGYIRTELEKTGLAEFEEKQRELCKKLIEPHWEENLSLEESAFLSYFFSGGVYGSRTTGIVNKLAGETGSKERKITLWMKMKYVFGRIFPPMEYYRQCYPFFYKHKVLIPFCVIYRVFMAIFRRNDFVKSEMKILKKK